MKRKSRGFLFSPREPGQFRFPASRARRARAGRRGVRFRGREPIWVLEAHTQPQKNLISREASTHYGTALPTLLDFWTAHKNYVRSPRVRTKSVALGVRLAACSVSLVCPRTRAGKEVRSSYGALASTTPRVCLDGKMSQSSDYGAGIRVQLWAGSRAPP